MKQVKSKMNWWRNWLFKAGMPLLIVPIVAVVWACYAAYVTDNGMPVADDGSWSLSLIHI